MLGYVIAAISVALGAFGTAETEWSGPAEMVYETGFAQTVRRLTGGGVGLFDMELIENDTPGAGLSEKGISEDVVWGHNRALKVLRLDDPRAERAYVVIFTNTSQPAHPLSFSVNGHQGQLTKNNRETYRWAEFPVSALREGNNVIELSCPEARSEEEGWSLYLARADEFEDGGGDPAEVGKTSFKSIDGGETWLESPFGPDGQTRAEYTVRLSLDRHLRHGILATPVIDLWRGDSDDFMTPLRRLSEIHIEIDGETPPETQIDYFIRGGTSPSPGSSEWEPYQRIGSGSRLRHTIDGDAFARRYVQVKAELRSRNPLATPVLNSFRIRAAVTDTVPPVDTIFVVRTDNPVIQYPSVDWKWERWDRPEFDELISRANLDEVIAGTRTDFEAQVRLLNHVNSIWSDGNPIPEYPLWNAVSILDRLDKTGAGGMCIQNNLTLAGFLLAYGWQARHVNITAHEICEVWNDEFAKWVYLDAHRVNMYVYDKETGEPLSMLELHERFLDEFIGDRPMDWMNDHLWAPLEGTDWSVEVAKAGPHLPNHHNALTLAAFARMVPRNNWFEEPYPRPLTHGSSWWPWDGYINWYDERTPPKRQYSWHTDRPQDMWPSLNLTRVHATTLNAHDRLMLRFETYTPNFSHFEVNVDETGWREVGERWIWLLQAGRNHLRARAVNMQGVCGKPSEIVVNRVDLPGDSR